MKYSHVTYDWKQGGCEEYWEYALGEFDLILTQDPYHVGSDQYAYFITQSKPTIAELREIMIDVYGEAIADCYTRAAPASRVSLWSCPTCGKTQDKC
jgi:hypothetical protein